MLKNLSQLETKVGEKTYQFLCDIDSPLEHVKEALFHFNQYCLAVEAKVKEAQDKQKAEAEVKTE